MEIIYETMKNKLEMNMVDEPLRLKVSYMDDGQDIAQGMGKKWLKRLVKFLRLHLSMP